MVSEQMVTTVPEQMVTIHVPEQMVTEQMVTTHVPKQMVTTIPEQMVTTHVPQQMVWPPMCPSRWCNARGRRPRALLFTRPRASYLVLLRD